MLTGVLPGLGCMRLSTDRDCDEPRALETLRAAIDAGITVLDTARAYARDDSDLGANERLLSRALRERPAAAQQIRIVTKGGMRRPGGRWEPDGRARALREDCEASLEALEGLPIDLYLLHAPDPRVKWSTSVRALAELVEAGLVRRIGLSNVNRRQLDEALGLAPIAAVELALGPFSETALRGGVVARCIDAKIEVLAHSPLGGPARAEKLSRDPDLALIASRHGVTAQRVALAAVADLHPSILPIPGARRPETVRLCAAAISLDDDDRAILNRRFGWREVLAPPSPCEPSSSSGAPELVLVMGVQGAGKSTLASESVGRGYRRLNRDERGGTMDDLHGALDELLASGARRVVADNTYTTRAGRQVVLEVARRHGARTHGIWLDTALAQAQINVILRMLDVHGRLLEPEEMARARDPSRLGPGAVQRLVRDLEVPNRDEGFASLEVVPFVRRPRPGHAGVAEFLSLEVAERGVRPMGPLGLVFGWKPGIAEADIALMQQAFGTTVRFCPHAGGPPRCWCRPPLPGLLLEFALQHRVDLNRSVIVGTRPVHATLARVLGSSYRTLSVGPQA
jgi:aryl-alcohol dehydrogenase-like predicted oxidoreductase